MKYHFVGVGGSGMSGVAQVLAGQGHHVSGSDRSLDQKLTPDIFEKLSAQGIALFPQDGSGVQSDTDFLVISTAIEETNPDISAARGYNIAIKKRADLLAELVNEKRGVAVGGSSGKTTSTAMAAWVADRGGLDPTVINGGFIKDYITESLLGNARPGKGDVVCIEADESDGSITNYRPEVGVITNISKDHKTIEELIELFKEFASHTHGTLILNGDCPLLRSSGITHKNTVTFGIEGRPDVKAVQIQLTQTGCSFAVASTTFELRIPGEYNISNALAAIAVGRELGIANQTMADALAEFRGVSRRMDLVGEANGVKVIDDFAHNPAKIEASLRAVQPYCRRVLAIYQPHGFGPTKFLRDELVETFSTILREEDAIHMLKIYYAGGTADMSISSDELVREIKERGKNAFDHTDREALAERIASDAMPGDIVLVMGARDNTLPHFCAAILERISKRERT